MARVGVEAWAVGAVARVVAGPGVEAAGAGGSAQVVVAILGAVVPRVAGKREPDIMLKRLQTCFKHRWMDESDTRRTFGSDLLERLTRRVAASERRHSGEIRICVEAGLPMSYLWRHLWHRTPVQVLCRERAMSMFGRLQVWDTTNNNGVLIYLLLAEREIELVADRGLNALVPHTQWQAMVQRMSAAFAAGRYEDGLTQALGEVSAVLVSNFPESADGAGPNELPDTPVLN